MNLRGRKNALLYVLVKYLAYIYEMNHNNNNNIKLIIKLIIKNEIENRRL